MKLVIVAVYLLTYAAIEFAYLKTAAPMYERNFFRVQGSRMRVQYSLPWSVAAYAILLPAVYFFVIRHLFDEKHEYGQTAVRATVLALAIYGVYNATNAATLKEYSAKVAVIDTIWGIVAINVVAAACHLAAKSLRP
jgi:uncharacterized membrane protein